MDLAHDKEYFIVSSSKSTSVDVKLDVDLSIPYTHVLVSSIDIQKTWYSLPSNSSLTVNENGTIRTMVFPKGTYNIRSLRTYFLARAVIDLGWTYAMTIPDAQAGPDTSKYTWTVSGNGGVQPIFSTTDPYLADHLGIDENVNNAFVADSFTSTNVVIFQSVDFIWIFSSIVKNKTGLLQEVYVSNNAFNSTITFSPSNIESAAKRLTTTRNNIYRFTLLDSRSNRIDLNGGTWSMILCIFKAYSATEPIRRYIEYKLKKEEILEENDESSEI